MSASHDAPNDETHEIHPHPPMPAVHDEAADSPAWLPIVGVSIVVLMVLFAMLRSHMQPEVAGIEEPPAADPAPAVEAPAPPAH
jgi:hypothetical protein